MAPSPTQAPTSEIGAGASVPLAGALSWGSFLDDRERVPELRWPRSVIEYDRMRNDSQVQALRRGSDLPLRRYRWEIDPNGADASIVDRISEDMGLPVKGSRDEVDDTHNGFNHDDHLRHALLAQDYGHMFMEIVGEVVDGWWRLRKLAPRMPLTIARIDIEPDGSLKSIRQNISRQPMMVAPDIPAASLAAFVWDREGANWAGRSVLRPLWPNWLLKARLLRVDTTKHDRFGTGVPVAKATVETVGRKALAKAAEMAQRLRGGNNTGGALPYGVDMKLMGIEGSVPDTIASIKYHDEAMARALLMMFMQLGQTQTGSRALGGSFIDFFGLTLDAVAHWYATVMTRIVFRKWVVWNVGESSPTPKLTYIPGDRDLAVADIVSMVDKGILTVDPVFEAWIRGTYRMPPLDPDATPRAVPIPSSGGTASVPGDGTSTALGDGTGTVAKSGWQLTREARIKAAQQAADSPIPLPPRVLHRIPNEHEIAAAVDFAKLDQQTQDAVDQLVSEWGSIKTAQINELVDVIAASGGDLATLSTITASTVGGDSIIASVMHDVASAAASAAVQEAKAQGVKGAKVPDLTDLKASLSARASAVDMLLTRSISEAGARKATGLAGGALGPDDIANEVAAYLGGLSDSYLVDQFTGAVMQAGNSARREVMRAEEPSKVYASELLDENTCDNCDAIDGTEYATVDEAEADYPSGGYMDCLGGPRCRGTLVAIYNESAATVD